MPAFVAACRVSSRKFRRKVLFARDRVADKPSFTDTAPCSFNRPVPFWPGPPIAIADGIDGVTTRPYWLARRRQVSDESERP